MENKGICFYLHAHQPWRIKPYSVFSTGNDHEYFDDISSNDTNNQKVLEKVADKSYRPMNARLLKLLQAYPDFKVSLSITGTLIEQLTRWAPDVLADFRALVDTGQVELVAETYYHSLAFFYDKTEFTNQVEKQMECIERAFGIRPVAFRNTELAYNDSLAQWAESQGFKTILAEGWDPILAGRSPNQIYQPPNTENIGLLLKNYRLSDDVAFRFSDKHWKHYPLHADRYADWLDASLKDDDQVVNLFMDYETFGENVWEDTGIFDFFEAFVDNWSERNDVNFYTVSEATDTFEKRGEISMPSTVTWADSERDLSAWLGNSMQHEAMRHVYELTDSVMQTGDSQLIADWRRLQTSDHTYYMSTKWSNDGDVHAYFSPYDSPYDAFLYYMNAVRDIRYRVMHDTGGLYG